VRVGGGGAPAEQGNFTAISFERQSMAGSDVETQEGGGAAAAGISGKRDT
jgi:hypothetical protein